MGRSEQQQHSLCLQIHHDHKPSWVEGNQSAAGHMGKRPRDGSGTHHLNPSRLFSWADRNAAGMISLCSPAYSLMGLGEKTEVRGKGELCRHHQHSSIAASSLYSGPHCSHQYFWSFIKTGLQMTATANTEHRDLKPSPPLHPLHTRRPINNGQF